MATAQRTSSASTPNDLDDVTTLTEVLRRRAQLTPDKAAFTFRSPRDKGRHVLTFSDLYQLGGRWAGTLHGRGIGRGHYVVNTLPNCPERVVVDVAIMMCGAATVNGMCQLKDASDLKTTLRQSGARAVVIDPDVMPVAYTALLADSTPPGEDGAVTCDSWPSLKFILPVQRRTDETDFLTTLRKDSSVDIYHDEQVSGEDVCIVFTTSGTTGFSKLVVFTHGTLMSLCKLVKRPPSTVQYKSSPFGWSGGYFGQILMGGFTRVLLDARDGTPEDLASTIFRIVKEEGVTSGVVPLHLLPDLVKLVEEENGGQPLFQTMGVGTQPITQHMVQSASKVARVLVTGYALTEMTMVSAAFGLRPEVFEEYCTGSVYPGVEVKIVNDEGREVGRESRGEVLIRSPYSFRGYLNDPDATRAVFTDDGFFRTGDEGWLDSEGQLYVEGRCGDAIMRGSYIFYPAWLEARIRHCPAVRDVMVVGVPDVTLGSELCACVILESPEVSIDDVKKFVEDDITADTDDVQSPRPRHYVLFESFPVTSTDKANRSEVTRMASERLQRLDQ
ncbi:long-chain-fatty-acid--CoA ligase FadD13-like [Littorina saxatilis]|uniref:Uncharacterized protein n=1 Tax=Littorina saxatilis TaxID=31220 RepID=A0AAN9GEB8_9CAEN